MKTRDIMRTGIYVQKPTTVTIRASASQDARVQLRRFRAASCEADARAHLREPDAVGTHQLDAGIYLIVSSGPMQVAGDNVTMQIVANDKDGWPDPPAPVIGLVSESTSTTLKAIKDFFAVTKGIEVSDAAEKPAGTARITDDPDGI
jgi:hypothetical protein